MIPLTLFIIVAVAIPNAYGMAHDYDGFCRFGSNAKDWIRDLHKDSATECHDECISDDACVAFAYSTDHPLSCDLYKGGPYTKGNDRPNSKCYLLLPNEIHDGFCRYGSDEKNWIRDLYTTNQRKCYDECESDVDCVAFAFSTDAVFNCDLYQGGPYTTGNERSHSTCYIMPGERFLTASTTESPTTESVSEDSTSTESSSGSSETTTEMETEEEAIESEKCHCEHTDGWSPQNGIMCGQEGNVERVSWCAHWETCTGTTEWSSGKDPANKSELCEAKCGCTTANGQVGNNGFTCGLNGNSAVTGVYCAATETCTGTTDWSNGVNFSNRSSLCSPTS